MKLISYKGSLYKRAIKKIVCGLCYEWALTYIHNHSDATLVHGTVHTPFVTPPHTYPHAWIEHNGLVKDWQTMEAGHGGKWNKKGYPIETFNELFKPKRITRYTKEEALINSVHFHHKGPWPADKKMTKTSSGKYGARPSLSDLHATIQKIKSRLVAYHGSTNPQVLELKHKAEGRLEVLEALLSDESWRMFKNA